MFAVAGVTGKVGGQVARNLLAQGHKVRAVVRNPDKGSEWASLGCEIAVASIDDAAALTAAFSETEGVFLLTPPNYDPEPGFPDTQHNAGAVRAAIEEGRPAKVVYLSTVGAQVTRPNLLNNSGITEAMLRSVAVPVTFLRAAWFMENASWDIESAKGGVVHSFLQPLDHRIPMVAAEDIAATAAELLGETWKSVRVVELEGPKRYSADDIAAALASALGNPVENKIVPRSSWEELFRSQGMKNPFPGCKCSTASTKAGSISSQDRKPRVKAGSRWRVRSGPSFDAKAAKPVLTKGFRNEPYIHYRIFRRARPYGGTAPHAAGAFRRPARAQHQPCCGDTSQGSRSTSDSHWRPFQPAANALGRESGECTRDVRCHHSQCSRRVSGAPQRIETEDGLPMYSRSTVSRLTFSRRSSIPLIGRSISVRGFTKTEIPASAT